MLTSLTLVSLLLLAFMCNKYKCRALACLVLIEWYLFGFYFLAIFNIWYQNVGWFKLDSCFFLLFSVIPIPHVYFLKRILLPYIVNNGLNYVVACNKFIIVMYYFLITKSSVYLLVYIEKLLIFKRSRDPGDKKLWKKLLADIHS